MHDTVQKHHRNNFSLVLVFIFYVNKLIRLDTEPPRGKQKFQKVLIMNLQGWEDKWKHVFQALVNVEISGYFAPMTEMTRNV